VVPVVFVIAYTDADTVERIHDKDPDAPVLADQNSLARPRPTKGRDLPGAQSHFNVDYAKEALSRGMVMSRGDYPLRLHEIRMNMPIRDFSQALKFSFGDFLCL
jgi:hypothetical protein